METKQIRRIQRKKRIRAKVFGTAQRPRFSVFKSSMHIYGQIIDDEKQVTLVAASDSKIKEGKGIEVAEKVGMEIAKLAVAKKIKKVVFDRNGFRFHGRVKALADGARKGGLEF